MRRRLKGEGSDAASGKKKGIRRATGVCERSAGKYKRGGKGHFGPIILTNLRGLGGESGGPGRGKKNKRNYIFLAHGRANLTTERLAGFQKKKVHL